MFDKRDMKTVENFTGCHVPEAICFCMWCVANQDARGGSLEDFQVVSLDKGKCSASNFLEMGQGWFMAKPEFIRGSPVKGRGSREVGKVSGCCTELVPQFGGCVAREVHRPCFSEDCVVKAFRAAVVGGGVWCSQLMVYAM